MRIWAYPMIRTGCDNLYGKLGLPMAALVGAISTAVPASAQTSDTFQAFQSRCLTPMLEVRESDVDGLTRVPHRAAWETWRMEGADWELQRALPGAAIQYCSIHGPFGAEVTEWIDAAIASGDWIDLDLPRRTLQSVYLREPVIEVEMVPHLTNPQLTVIETNLES